MKSGRKISYDGRIISNLDDTSSGVSEHYTLIFNVFIFMQIFNLLNCYFYGNQFTFSFRFIKNKFSDNYVFLIIFFGLSVC